MNINFITKAIVAITLLSLVAWLGFVIHDMPRDVNKGLGVCLVIFGVFYLLLHRRHARQFFEWSQLKPTKLAWFWNALGSPGIRFLFLAIGIILLVSGIVSWITGWNST